MRSLGVESYGVYTAMFSLMTWLFLFDIGISKGMRNHLTIALVDNKIITAKELISTAYFTTGGASFFFFIAIVIFTWNFDLASFLNITIYSSSQIFKLYIVFLIIMFSKLFFGTIDQILYAKHKSSINSLNVLSINILYVLLLVFCLFNDLDNIVLISTFYGVCVVFSYTFTTIFFFRNNKILIPSFSFYKKFLIKEIMGDGLKILLIQMFFFTFVGLDRFILLKEASGVEVTNYDIMYKVMSLLLFPWSVIAQPLWSSYAEAYKRNDLAWIKKIYKRLILFFVLIAFGVLFLSYIFNFITSIWINEVLNVDFKTLLLTGLLILTIMWSTMHSDILFGISKYRTGIIGATLGVLIKMSLIYWCINSGFSISKLLLSSILAYMIFCVIAPLNIYITLKEE